MSCGGNRDGSPNANAAAVKTAVQGLPVTVAQGRRAFHELVGEVRGELATAHHVPLTHEHVHATYQDLCDRFPHGHFGLALHQYPGSDLRWMEISVIRFDKDQQGHGHGTAVMNHLTSTADANGWLLTLTPDGQWGSRVPRLKRFYARHGFVPNSGRHRDYRISNTMLRHPVPPRSEQDLTEAAHAEARRRLRHHLEHLTGTAPSSGTAPPSSQTGLPSS